jgi:hypothetical protein
MPASSITATLFRSCMRRLFCIIALELCPHSKHPLARLLGRLYSTLFNLSQWSMHSGWYGCLQGSATNDSPPSNSTRQITHLQQNRLRVRIHQDICYSDQTLLHVEQLILTAPRCHLAPGKSLKAVTKWYLQTGLCSPCRRPRPAQLAPETTTPQ